MASIALLLLFLLTQVALAQTSNPSTNNQRKGEAGRAKTGILLLAHGGRQGWNAEVGKLSSEVDKTMPVEIAFGMASKRTMQEAIDRLVARGVREIVAVPLFISSHSSVITSTEYLLGRRPVAPPDLAMFAGMDHSHGGGDHSAMSGDHSMMMDTSFDPKTPVKSPVPILMSAALDRHPLVADILLARARSISREPSREVVILVAHGPVPDDDNAMWLADMGVLAQRMRAASRYKRIEYLTVRDDAGEPLRSQAAAELRKAVERATAEGSKVLIVPLLLSYGGIEEGIRKRLAGLDYTMSTQGLLPDERLVRWVLLSARAASENR